MKKILEICICLAGIVLLLEGCRFESGDISIPKSEQPEESPAPLFTEKTIETIENVAPTVIVENETIDSSQENGATVNSSDTYNGSPILSITPTKNGLLIKKNHPTTWAHNTIHVKNVSLGCDNVKVDNVDETVNEILYPFVKKRTEIRNLY